MANWNVIFYRTPVGNMPALEMIKQLDTEKKKRVESYLHELENRGNNISRAVSKKISDNIFELKVNDIRLFYYFGRSNFIVIVHSIVKKRQDLDAGDIRLAEKNRKDFIERYNV